MLFINQDVFLPCFSDLLCECVSPWLGRVPELLATCVKALVIGQLIRLRGLPPTQHCIQTDNIPLSLLSAFI
jgi:hypothetical protein